MERIPVPKGVNTETENLLNNIMDSALEIIDFTDKLDSAPTTSVGQLKNGQIGFYGGNLYCVIRNTTYRIGLTAV